MDKIKIGLIGTGAITDLHYLAYKDNPKIELHAVADIDKEILDMRAEKWGVKNKYTDYKQLLGNAEIDAVEIIVPHHLHAEIAEAALEAGKHVISDDGCLGSVTSLVSIPVMPVLMSTTSPPRPIALA